jgi:hypothetical protein
MNIKESIGELVKEAIFECLVEGKFSAAVEKIIKKRLKPEYGDPYKIKDPEKRKAASAKVFGTAMKIQKAMDAKKKRMKKKSK